uniref:carbonic anhydrase n=1 Tax=Oleiagrimonas sp. TaxID=2010330 RepID=UPI00260EFF33
EHVLVVGHYGCSGVGAVLKKQRLGLIDNWLRHVEDVAQQHIHALDDKLSFEQRHARLCELNAIEQAMHVCATTIVQEAWQRGQALRVHAWVYGLSDGRINDLGLDVHELGSMPQSYRHALDTLIGKWEREDAG